MAERLDGMLRLRGMDASGIDHVDSFYNAFRGTDTEAFRVRGINGAWILRNGDDPYADSPQDTIGNADPTNGNSGSQSFARASLRGLAGVSKWSILLRECFTLRGSWELPSQRTAALSASL